MFIVHHSCPHVHGITSLAWWKTHEKHLSYVGFVAPQNARDCWLLIKVKGVFSITSICTNLRCSGQNITKSQKGHWMLKIISQNQTFNFYYHLKPY
jgi:hypothetical protein